MRTKISFNTFSLLILIILTLFGLLLVFTQKTITGMVVAQSILTYNAWDYNNMAAPNIAPSIYKTIMVSGQFVDPNKVPANVKAQIFASAKNTGSDAIDKMILRAIIYKEGAFFQDLPLQIAPRTSPGQSQHMGFIINPMPAGKYRAALFLTLSCLDQNAQFYDCGKTSMTIDFIVVDSEAAKPDAYIQWVDFIQSGVSMQPEMIKENTPYTLRYLIANLGPGAVPIGSATSVYINGKYSAGASLQGEIVSGGQQLIVLPMSGLPAGKYPIKIEIVPTGISDKDLTNNNAYPTITVQGEARPDTKLEYQAENLVMQDNNYVDKLWVKEKKPFYIKFRIRNVGDINARPTYYAKIGSVEKLATMPVEIVPGGYHDGVVYFDPMAPTSAKLILRVDALTNEKNPQDNYVEVPDGIRIVVDETKITQPTIPVVSPTPPSYPDAQIDVQDVYQNTYKKLDEVQEGQSFYLRFKIKNIGGKVISSSYIEAWLGEGAQTKYSTQNIQKYVQPNTEEIIGLEFPATPAGTYSVLVRIRDITDETNKANNEIRTKIIVQPKYQPPPPQPTPQLQPVPVPITPVPQQSLVYDIAIDDSNGKVTRQGVDYTDQVKQNIPVDIIFNVKNVGSKDFIEPYGYSVFINGAIHRNAVTNRLLRVGESDPVYVSWWPKQLGIFNIEVSASVSYAEINKDNNAKKYTVTVIPEKAIKNDLAISTLSTAIFSDSYSKKQGKNIITLSLKLVNKGNKLSKVPVLIDYGVKKTVYLDMDAGETTANELLEVDRTQFPKHIIASLDYDNIDKTNDLVKIPVTLEKNGVYYSLN